MSQPTRGSQPCPDVHCSSFKGIFPVCVSLGLHLVEWTRHIVGLSYFAAAHTVHSSGWRLQMTLHVGLSKMSVLHQYCININMCCWVWTYIEPSSFFIIIAKLYYFILLKMVVLGRKQLGKHGKEELIERVTNSKLNSWKNFKSSFQIRWIP